MCVLLELNSPQVSSSDLLLKERPLDLRRPTLQKNLRLRSQVAMAMREFLINNHGERA